MVGCASDGSKVVQPITSCETRDNARPVCGFQNPEDLAVLPGDEAVLVSEYGAMEGGKAGGLALLVVATDERRTLFRGGDADGATATWGDDACPGPPTAEFSPHGIHVSRRQDGALQLLAVQHGGRESIEFFEVLGRGAEASVAWRGCAVAPKDSWLNEVAALPDGGFLTTHMMSRSLGSEALIENYESAAAPTGYVFEWQPGRGFEVLENTRSVLPNGIEVAPDGSSFFVNVSGENEVRRYSVSTGELEASVVVQATDNATWAPDGRLLVASLVADTDDFAICLTLPPGTACPLAFEIIAIDWATLETEVLYSNEGPPMGAGTVGLQVGRELFVGSFAGDRVLRVILD
jgi:lipoprotein-anchoring transpeptidase ErfK/SrfK